MGRRLERAYKSLGMFEDQASRVLQVSIHPCWVEMGAVAGLDLVARVIW